MPGGGIIVGLAGLFGGAAAKNKTELSSTRDPNCPPGSFDFDCYGSSVSEGSESVFGTSVPAWWVALESVPAGVIASLAAMVCVLAGALAIYLVRPREAS